MESVARRWFALLVLGSASFTLFGSLVPFQFQSKTWSEAVDDFAWAMTNRIKIDSRSDGIANVMLGVPLGFGLLGVICADRCVSRWRASLYGLAMLPGCCAFAASVEFAQLFVPVRTCSGADVLAQTLGSAIGMATWLVRGQWLTDEIRKATTGIGAAGRFLIGYVLLLGFIQALPLDLTLSPADVYRKFRDGGVRLIPFGEYRHLSGDKAWERNAGLLKLAGLYLPAGLLAGCLPGRFWWGNGVGRVALTAFGLSASIEAGQLFVTGRSSSATDALIGALAAMLGWKLARSKAEKGWILGSVWFLLMAAISWEPLTFPGPSQPFDWIPGMPLEGGNPLSALENMLTKLVLFGLIGVLVAATQVVKRDWKLLAAAAIGWLTSAVFEVVQTQTPNHSPSITDVLLGGFGSFAGAWTRGRVFVVSEEIRR
jgi:VanZ family protein